MKDTTLEEVVNASIETVIEQISRRVNLPSETEDLIEEALHQAAKYGVEVAQELAHALRRRINEDTV